MKIQVILSSTRPGRVGERVAKWVYAAAKDQLDFEVELIDLADYDLPHFNEPASPRFNPKRDPHPEVKRWLAKVAEADGYVIVTPEYNHSVPGILKDALDFLDFQFVKKPAAIVSYGSVGGARAAEQLKLILVEVKAAVVPEAVALYGPGTVLDEHGQFSDDTTDTHRHEQVLSGVLTQLGWWAAALKAGREAVPAHR
jgi:NAD(P)H-dependent FMN reductase